VNVWVWDHEGDLARTFSLPAPALSPAEAWAELEAVLTSRGDPFERAERHLLGTRREGADPGGGAPWPGSPEGLLLLDVRADRLSVQTIADLGMGRVHVYALTRYVLDRARPLVRSANYFLAVRGPHLACWKYGGNDRQFDRVGGDDVDSGGVARLLERAARQAR
jgi:hypothetical protein